MGSYDIQLTNVEGLIKEITKADKVNQGLILILINSIHKGERVGRIRAECTQLIVKFIEDNLIGYQQETDINRGVLEKAIHEILAREFGESAYRFIINKDLEFIRMLQSAKIKVLKRRYADMIIEMNCEFNIRRAVLCSELDTFLKINQIFNKLLTLPNVETDIERCALVESFHIIKRRYSIKSKECKIKGIPNIQLSIEQKLELFQSVYGNTREDILEIFGRLYQHLGCLDKIKDELMIQEKLWLNILKKFEISELSPTNPESNTTIIEKSADEYRDIYPDIYDKSRTIDIATRKEITNGNVYAFYNPSFVGKFLKVGKTGKTVEERLRALSNTSVPESFIEISSVVVKNDQLAEKFVHMIMEYFGLRVSPRKEFFLVDVDTVNTLFNMYKMIEPDIIKAFYKIGR